MRSKLRDSQTKSVVCAPACEPGPKRPVTGAIAVGPGLIFPSEKPGASLRRYSTVSDEPSEETWSIDHPDQSFWKLESRENRGSKSKGRTTSFEYLFIT